jgi:hypothetical protein
LCAQLSPADGVVLRIGLNNPVMIQNYVFVYLEFDNMGSIAMQQRFHPGLNHHLILFEYLSERSVFPSPFTVRCSIVFQKSGRLIAIATLCENPPC